MGTQRSSDKVRIPIVEERPISEQIFGRTLGLKPAELKALKRLRTRKTNPSDVVGLPLARNLASLSRDLNRRIGVLLDRRGRVTHISVGDATRIWVPEFGRVRAGKGRLRGLRWVVTYLRGEPLTRDDITDLVRLRFDLIASIEACDDGLPGLVHMAHVAPYGKGTETRVDPCSIHDLDMDFSAWVAELEADLAQSMPVGTEHRAGGPRAILAYVDVPGELSAKTVMPELRELARTAGLQVVAEEVQRRKAVDHRYVFGSGRIQELNLRALQMDAEIIVFGRELSSTQMRSMSTVTELKVIDRTQLILDIFAQHAKTREGKLQVELAQLKYLLPRLTGRRDALSRLAGGIGGRGPGETQLEIDRRRAKDRINLLDKKINHLSRQRETRRRQRRKNAVPVVGIVGYTNAGKSTLLNALTGSDVVAEDKLFATLDPTTRRLRFPEEREIVLADTVGFIRELPPDLAKAFRATLEELGDADLLLHVVDISDPAVVEQMEAVMDTLKSLELGEIPSVIVLNKTDRSHDEELRSALEVQWSAVSMSAMDRGTLAPLVGRLSLALFGFDADVERVLPPRKLSKPRPSAEWSPLDP